MKKEIGIPANASKKIKKLDEKMDKSKGIKEGSVADLRADKKLLKEQGYPNKMRKGK